MSTVRLPSVPQLPRAVRSLSGLCLLSAYTQSSMSYLETTVFCKLRVRNPWRNDADVAICASQRPSRVGKGVVAFACSRPSKPSLLLVLAMPALPLHQAGACSNLKASPLSAEITTAWSWPSFPNPPWVSYPLSPKPVNRWCHRTACDLPSPCNNIVLSIDTSMHPTCCIVFGEILKKLCVAAHTTPSTGYTWPQSRRPAHACITCA